DCVEKEIKVISNAGGVNVVGAVNEIQKISKKLNLQGLKIGYILGDDLKDKIPELLAQGIEFRNIDNKDQSFRSIIDNIVSANVYYGHEPILECLEKDANVIITGRVADPCMFLAPLAYEFGWGKNDYNNLAKGIMAGHLLECGGQVSGGNYDYGWKE